MVSLRYDKRLLYKSKFMWWQRLPFPVHKINICIYLLGWWLVRVFSLGGEIVYKNNGFDERFFVVTLIKTSIYCKACSSYKHSWHSMSFKTKNTAKTVNYYEIFLNYWFLQWTSYPWDIVCPYLIKPYFYPTSF